MLIEKRSILTGVLHKRDIAVTPEQLKRHKSGELIQDVCPHLSAADREFLVSGATTEEWRTMMSCESCEQ